MRARKAEKGKKPVGRPMEFDRDEAVRVAMNQFWKRGFEAVSVSDLAGAMSIKRSSFYNSFGGREAVFLEALETYLRASPDAALADVRPGQPVTPALRRAFREICRVRSADPDARGCLVINSIGELVGVNEKLSRRIEEALQNVVRLFEKLLRQAVDQEEIERPEDIRATAKAFVAFLCGLNTISKVIRDEGALWKMCDAFLALHGFGARR